MNSNNKEPKRLEAYQNFIINAAKIREANITVANLADKLNIRPTGIYRMEKGNQDIKLSTLLTYLQAFGYKLAIIPDALEIVPNRPKFNSEFAGIEQIPIPSKRKQRLLLLRYLVYLEELALNDKEE